MKKSSFQIKREKIATNIIKLKLITVTMFAMMVSAGFLCFTNIDYKPLIIHNFSLALFIFAVIYFFMIPKINQLEKTEDNLIQRDKKIIHGKRKCKLCEKWFLFLWPQQGGICNSCLYLNYTISEAKEGVSMIHYEELDEMFMAFSRNKEMPWKIFLILFL